MDPLLTKAKVDVDERIEILPEELVTLATDGTVAATIFLLQEKYTLTEKQVTLLENEILLVLALFLSPQEFTQNVQDSLEVTQETAQAIADEVNEEIFSLVQDILDTVVKARKELNTNLGTANLQAKLEKKDNLEQLTETFEKRDPQRLTDPNVQEYTGNVEPIHTMEEDMGRIHGYGAYREKYKDQDDAEDARST